MTRKVRKNEERNATDVPSIDREPFKLSLANSTDSRKCAIAGTSCRHSNTAFKVIFCKNAKVYTNFYRHPSRTMED